MCFSSPKTPTVETVNVAAPAPIESASYLAPAATAGQKGAATKKKGRSSLVIPRNEGTGVTPVTGGSGLSLAS